MHISHDSESGALYLKLREGRYDHTEDFSEKADVYLDVDADGNVLGLEALSFDDLAQAIGERGGRLELPERLEPDAYELALRRSFEEGYQGGAYGSATQAADQASGTVGQIADEAAEAAGQVGDQASGVTGKASARQDEPDREAVREAVASLGRDDRAVLEMLLGEGLNIVDLAERLGVSVVEAQRRRRAAFETLNDALLRRGSTGRRNRSAKDVFRS